MKGLSHPSNPSISRKLKRELTSAILIGAGLAYGAIICLVTIIKAVIE